MNTAPSDALGPPWWGLVPLAALLLVAGLLGLRPLAAPSGAAEASELAIAFYKVGQPQVAGRMMRAIFEEEGSPPPRLWYAAGLLAMDEQRQAEAIEYLTKAAKALPDNEEVLVTLGAAHQVAQRFGEAEAIYRRMLAKNPTQPRALYNLALVRLHQNDARGGRDLLVRLRASAPYTPEARYIDQKIAQLNALLERGVTAPPPPPRGAQR